MVLLFGLIRAGLGITLLLAGIGKVAIRPEFTASAARFLPGPARRHAGQAAVAVIAVEITAGLATLLIVGSAFLDGIDVALFAALLAVSLIGYWRHRGTPCRCFGALGKGEFNRRTIARNALLVLGAVSLPIFEPAQRSGVLSLPWLISAGAIAAVSLAFFQSAVVLADARKGT